MGETRDDLPYEVRASAALPPAPSPRRPDNPGGGRFALFLLVFLVMIAIVVTTVLTVPWLAGVIGRMRWLSCPAGAFLAEPDGRPDPAVEIGLMMFVGTTLFTAVMLVGQRVFGGTLSAEINGVSVPGDRIVLVPLLPLAYVAIITVMYLGFQVCLAPDGIAHTPAVFMDARRYAWSEVRAIEPWCRVSYTEQNVRREYAGFTFRMASGARFDIPAGSFAAAHEALDAALRGVAFDFPLSGIDPDRKAAELPFLLARPG